MRCEHCGEREASVHLTKIRNGVKKEYNLCEECAQKLNAFSNEVSFDFHNFFSGLLDNEFPFSSKQFQERELSCPQCNMKYSTFKKIGRVGCDQCYHAFEKYMNPLIRRIHGSDYHSGKVPNHASKEIKIKKEIEELEKQLKKAVENEEYELAAKIRDQIKEKNKEL
ncbi:UvrB/UvrC motif-containing protein [Garciella nitratireducens]|uniref:Protein-arginine kinase activator protein McsA n=1 Tax=Garciella nitratireducens DSM 15102 TaxID=1121911 RepID=A0A1T4PM64_9FIRM|nr:UvrB/UvrC motif-containing protein [Garciella nitratireducens]RBP44843.1 protein arginine kinase activator [Garciella nitratireducens]SJZ92356.1 Protein-arginine kinase activator protein McsA [Garciella nitratireducens DSM 15102]